MTEIKLFQNGTVVSKEQEPFVRLIQVTKNIKQGGQQSTEQHFYELVPDVEVMQTFLSFGGLN